MRHDHSGEYLSEIQQQITSFQLGINQTVDGLGDRFSSMSEDSKKYYQMYQELLNRLTTLNRYGDNLCELNRTLNTDWTQFEKETHKKLQRIKDERLQLQEALSSCTSSIAEIHAQIKKQTKIMHNIGQKYEEFKASELTLDRKLHCLTEQISKADIIDTTEIESNINKLRDELAQKEAELDLTGRSLAILEQKRKIMMHLPALTSRIEEVRKSHAGVQNCLETTNERIESTKRSIDTKRRITETLRAGLTELLALHDERNQLILEKRSFRREKMIVDSELKSKRTELSKCEGILSNITQEMHELDRAEDELTRNIELTEQKIDDYENNPIVLQWAIKEEQLAEIVKEIEAEEEIEATLRAELDKIGTIDDISNIVTVDVIPETVSQEKSLTREILDTRDEIKSINAEIEKQHEALNVLIAEHIRLQHDMKYQAKRKKYYASKAEHKIEKHVVDTRIIECVGEIEEIVRDRRKELGNKRKILREKQACIDQLFATRRFKTVTSVGSSDDIEAMMEILNSRIKYYKLICQSCSWITELYKSQKAKLASGVMKPSIVMKEWNASLDLAYPRAEDALILANAYLIE